MRYNLSVNNTRDWVFNFNLSIPIEYLGKITNTSNIEINTNNNHIAGFSITIKDLSYSEAEEKSKKKATNLANVMTIKSTMPVKTYLASYHSISKNSSSTVGVSKATSYKIDGAIQDLDLSDTIIKEIITSSPPHSEYYRHLSKAIFHYYNNNNIDCIKEAYLIIENNPKFSSPSNSIDEYTALRNIFSHPRTPGNSYTKETFDLFINTFNQDDLDYIENSSSKTITIDVESKKNRDRFESIANKFVKEITAYLKL